MLLNSGIYTGSIYPDLRSNFPGSDICPTEGKVQVIKTHEAKEYVDRTKCPRGVQFSKAIHIVRNPYDALISDFNLNKGGKTRFASELAFQTSRKFKLYSKYCCHLFRILLKKILKIIDMFGSNLPLWFTLV